MTPSDDADSPELSALLTRAPAAARRGGAYLLLAVVFAGLVWAALTTVERSAAGRYVIEPTAVRAAFAPRSGALSAVYKTDGAAVRAGEAIAEIDSPGGRIALRAPIDGVILRGPGGPLGRAVSAGAPLAALGAPEDARRAALLLAGPAAQSVRIGDAVVFDGRPEWRGRILRVSPPGPDGAVRAEAAVDGPAQLGAHGAARVVIARRSLYAAAFGAPE